MATKGIIKYKDYYIYKNSNGFYSISSIGQTLLYTNDIKLVEKLYREIISNN